MPRDLPRLTINTSEPAKVFAALKKAERV